jgi:hypothetical protein
MTSKSYTVSAVLLVSPMRCCKVRIVIIAVFHVVRHPEILLTTVERVLIVFIEELIFLLPLAIMVLGCLYVARHTKTINDEYRTR